MKRSTPKPNNKGIFVLNTPARCGEKVHIEHGDAKQPDPPADILTILRQLEPEHQNEVLRTVLSELAIDFENRRISARSESNRQQDCFETFLNLRDQPERALKALIDKAENGKSVRQ